jgi:hypothetical protein
MIHLRQLECADSVLEPCARCTTLTGNADVTFCDLSINQQRLTPIMDVSIVDHQSRICLYCKLDHSQSNMHIEEQEHLDNDRV